jgi:hypothetical protein
MVYELLFRAQNGLSAFFKPAAQPNQAFAL